MYPNKRLLKHMPQCTKGKGTDSSSHCYKKKHTYLYFMMFITVRVRL